jgi:phosphohistidine phosphatase
VLDSQSPESDSTVMRRLMLLRHAKTERAEPGQRDRDRKLMKRGRADAPTLGAYMAHHDLVPDLALVSPAARAQETWDLLAAAFDKPPRLKTDDRLYNATPHKLLELIAEPRKANGILVVGHNPGLHEFALQLIASGDVEAREQLREKLPTSGLVVVEVPIEDWRRLRPHSARLDRFVTPRLIAAATE